jgi:hypothetical protein
MTVSSCSLAASANVDPLILSSAPTPPQSRAINEIKRLLSRTTPDLATAKTHLSRAIGGNHSTLEPLRNAIRRPNLTDSQKLEFLLLAVPDADQAIVRHYGEECFEPTSEFYGHFWRLVETRGYVMLLLDIVISAADCGEYETAVEYAKRVLEVNHGDNNGWPPSVLSRPSVSMGPLVHKQASN